EFASARVDPCPWCGARTFIRDAVGNTIAVTVELATVCTDDRPRRRAGATVAAVDNAVAVFVRRRRRNRGGRRRRHRRRFGMAFPERVLQADAEHMIETAATVRIVVTRAQVDTQE